MFNQPTVGMDAARTGSLMTAAWAMYAQWLSTYGSAIVTTLSIVYGLYALYTRRMENRAIMRKNGGAPNVVPSE